jgi:DNA repair protein RecO (recombination protein O)
VGPEEIIGIVVGRTDLGEADRIVRLLTAEEGRVDLLAKGARRSKRRFAGALEPGTRLRAVRGRSRGELDLLLAADVLASPRRARGSYARLVLLTYGCEVSATLAVHGQDAEKGMRLLEAWLEVLEGEAEPADATRVAFEAKALTFSGLAPSLLQCPVCRVVLAGTCSFDLEAGGGVHPWCGTGDSVEAADLAVLERLRRTALAGTVDLAVPVAARWLLARFIEYQCRTGIRSRALLESPLEGP